MSPVRGTVTILPERLGTTVSQTSAGVVLQVEHHTQTSQEPRAKPKTHDFNFTYPPLLINWNFTRSVLNVYAGRLQTVFILELRTTLIFLIHNWRYNYWKKHDYLNFRKFEYNFVSTTWKTLRSKFEDFFSFIFDFRLVIIDPKNFRVSIFIWIRTFWYFYFDIFATWNSKFAHLTSDSWSATQKTFWYRFLFKNPFMCSQVKTIFVLFLKILVFKRHNNLFSFLFSEVEKQFRM